MTGVLHRRTWGEGPSQAVLLHGSTSSSATWWHVGPALAERGWRVTALDLPSHGDSASADRPLLPQAAAAAVGATLEDTTVVDLLVGHSFGGAAAAWLCAVRPTFTRRLVLEELPGGNSVDWAAEADALAGDAADAKTNPTAALQRTRAGQSRWHDVDCRHAVDDLIRCAASDISGGLRHGAEWAPAALLERITVPTTLLLAPDRVGVNHLEDATALRDNDRAVAIRALRADTTVVDSGHCIHRDQPDAWLRAVITGQPSLPPSR